ncbi:MAG: hypothetical protein ACRENK_16375 [Gemmatimonadaceae bacterium]
MTEWDRATAERYADEIEALEKERLELAKTNSRLMMTALRAFVAADTKLVRRIGAIEGKLIAWGLTVYAPSAHGRELIDEFEGIWVGVLETVESDVDETLRDEIALADEGDEGDDDGEEDE